MALPQGHLAWPIRGRPVVEQGTVLGTVEAKAGVDVASEGRHVRECQVKEAVAVESHGTPHQQVSGAAGAHACRVQPLEVHILAQGLDPFDAATD